MPWEQELVNLETSHEKGIEEKIENITPEKENILDNTKKIENINIFYECINDLLHEYKIILEIQSVGENVTEAIAVINDRLTKITNLGKEKFNLSDEEITNIKNNFYNIDKSEKISNFRK